METIYYDYMPNINLVYNIPWPPREHFGVHFGIAKKTGYQILDPGSYLEAADALQPSHTKFAPHLWFACQISASYIQYPALHIRVSGDRFLKTPKTSQSTLAGSTFREASNDYELVHMKWNHYVMTT